MAAAAANAALMGLGNSGWYAILQAQLYSALPGRSGTAMAANSVFGLVGGAIPVLLGWVAQTAGLPVALWLLLLGLVAMASSAYVKWRVVAAAVSLAFFFLLSGVSEMVDSVLRVTWGHVLDPAWAVNRVWCALLGVEPPNGPGAGASAWALAVLVLVLGVVIERKLRPVEVVS